MVDYVVLMFGAKPPWFSRWVFACLGAQSGDELDDLFPGSGLVGSEWASYMAQERLAV